MGEEQEDYPDSGLPQGGDQKFSAMVMSQNAKAKKFISEELLYNDIISHLDKITSIPMKKCKIHTQDITLKLINNPILTKLENVDANSRKIITKMIFLKNVLSIKSRLGPATIFIVGDNILEYLNSTSYDLNLSYKTDGNIGSINGTPIIHSSKINKNKVIASITQNEATTGLNVINNINNGDDYHQTYFIKETPTFENRIVWFEIS